MDKTVLITGGAGLVGTECCRLFAEKGWRVISVDNYMRGEIFGAEGNTKENISIGLEEVFTEIYETLAPYHG